MRRITGIIVLAMAMAVTLLSLALAGCTTELQIGRLRIATGNPNGVYDQLGTALAIAWQHQLGIDLPDVETSSGSPDNLNRLLTGQADVVFSAADVATEFRSTDRSPRALARIYDDYLHVVVRADAPITALRDLSGRRVSVGPEDSGVAVIADRLLNVAKVSDITREQLGLTEAADALRAGTIDAFFWSGGLPTEGITDLAKRIPIRLLDLHDVLPQLRNQYPVYGTASIPTSTYALGSGPVTTLVVSNYLLVTDAMPDDVAEALTQGLFDARPQLVAANSAALSIDPRPAIETSSVPLHPGAIRYYRDHKI